MYFVRKEKGMQVNSVSSTNQVSANSTGKLAQAGSNKMDSDQFMQILMAQLTHQNPLEPMDNAEMMSQFSQLNSLQELREIHSGMDQLSSSNQVMYLASLIGKPVKVNRTDGKVLEGVVESVVTEKGNPQLRIGNEEVPLDDVIEIQGEDL
jgi:flagellar basal-body rod modification protein FlgD